MFRKLCAFGLALVACGALVAGSGNRGRGHLIDNFNDGDADGWSQMDFTAGEPWGPATYDASDGEYLLEVPDPVPADDINVGTVIATWEGSRGEPRFANGVMRARVRANDFGTTAGLVMRANDVDHTNYGFYGSTTFGTFYIERFDLFDPDAPGQTIIAMADLDEDPFEAGKDYHIEAKLVGDRMSLTAWKVGAKKPKRPTLTVRDDTLGPDSGTLICVITFFDPAAVEDDFVDISASFDDVTFKAKRAGGRHHGDDDDDEDDDD
jgi:hypothetical protein